MIIMKKMVMIHTVPMIIEGLNKLLKNEIPDIQLENILDDHILGLVRQDEIKAEKRLQKLTDLARGSDGAQIVVTCSSLSTIAEGMEGVMMIDGFMHEEAIKYKKLLLAATAETAIAPTRRGIVKRSAGSGIILEEMIIPGAIEAFKEGDKDKHDSLVWENIKTKTDTADYDAVVLCQASMAHLKERVEEKTGMKVLTNTEYFLKFFKKKFEGEEDGRNG